MKTADSFHQVENKHVVSAKVLKTIMDNNNIEFIEFACKLSSKENLNKALMQTPKDKVEFMIVLIK